MKASELMIGDWVIATCKENIPPVAVLAMLPRAGRVVGIEADCIHLDFCDFGFMPQDLDPVPLTTEILEKNGFKFDGSGQCSMMFLSEPRFSEGQRFNIYVGFKHKTIEVFVAHPIEKSPNWRKTNKAYLEVCGPYVHELQHALRPCGIEKEIVLQGDSVKQ